MSKTRLLLIIITLLILSVGFSATAAAQSAPDDPNLQAILQAFSIARREGYHFTTKALTTNTYTAADGTAQSQYIGLDQEGDAAANGDNQQTTKITVGVTLEALKAFTPVTLLSVAFGDYLYIYLDPDDQWSVGVLNVKPGWWVFDDFKAQIADPSARFIVDGVISSGAPADTVENGTNLLRVDANGTERVDNRDMRDYTLWDNVLWGVLNSLPGTGSAHFANVLKYAPLFLSSNLSLSLQLQIGADDGRLYDMLMDSRRGVPYLAAHIADYNTENDSTGDTTFTYPFKPIVITPPDNSLLNH
ncbi:MAG: hypothetical protein ABI700_21935 [Chloroflexota bacterium]